MMFGLVWLIKDSWTSIGRKDVVFIGYPVGHSRLMRPKRRASDERAAEHQKTGRGAYTRQGRLVYDDEANGR